MEPTIDRRVSEVLAQAKRLRDAMDATHLMTAQLAVEAKRGRAQGPWLFTHSQMIAFASAVDMLFNLEPGRPLVVTDDRGGD